ncbi:hypothetical protein EDC04DRAFT_1000199 [Pisolithus marmoratus]|nr:hypothetical protein EDC04DRAFT_1000199 [Pisolithus marmoratus]
MCDNSLTGTLYLPLGKMKLLNVEVVLDREKDIQKDIQRAEYEYDVLNELDDETTSYAILSHRWGVEITYKEMTGLMKMKERKRGEVRKRYGYQKIIKSCEQAMKDGHRLLWIDTCCIDKRSSSELSEAINSMYRWYQNAQVCYALLNDVDESAIPTRRDYRKFDQSNGWPEWFMRGWTLQELIAPKQVKFFNKDWVFLGNKWHLAPALEDITGIPCAVLRHGLTGTRLSVARIISWAADRKTTRVEDRAYSLMGLFGVNMPMLYGEGNKAFQRLQLEIIRTSNDHSIFAWYPQVPRRGSVLAVDPSDFRHCGNIRNVYLDEFDCRLMDLIERNRLGRPWCTQRNSLKVSASPMHQCRLAQLRLRWRARTLSWQLTTLTVSGASIQVCLPIIPLPDSPAHFRAILPCTYGLGLVTIDLESAGSHFARIPRISATILKPYPEFKTLYLAHHQDINEKPCELTLTLDDMHASYHGFTRRGTYPRKFMDDTVTLSFVTNITADLIVIVYANEAGFCFAVGLGYYDNHGWVHIVYDGHFPPQHWAGFAENAYHQMWNARAEHARDMARQQAYLVRKDYFIKHAHLPRSIWAARVVWGRWDMDKREADNFRVMVDVEQCPGCCNGPCSWTTTSNDCGGLGLPGLMNTVSSSYSLRLDGWLATFDKCSGQRIALGDYAYCPVFSCASSNEKLGDCMKNQDDLAVAYHAQHKHLALHQAKGISLPSNEYFVLLLKALSPHLVGKQLVTTIVQCSSFYGVDENGKRRDSEDSAMDSGHQCTEGGISAPLYSIASPQVWRRELPCVQRRERFKIIREHFYALHQPLGADPGHKSANGRKKDRAIKFFLDMFGLKYLRNYIGKITFFESFPSILKTNPPRDILPAAGVAKADGSPAYPSKLSRTILVTRCNLPNNGLQSDAHAQSDPRLKVVLPLLRKRCQILCARHNVLHWYTDETHKVECELKFISQTLGDDLLKHIRTSFYNAYREQEYSTKASAQASHMTYDRQLNIPSAIQEIERLQMKLDAAKDEDEQRALEEDVTGKILWLCWCGVCTEVDQLLPKVVDYIRREGNEEVSGITRLNVIVIAVSRVSGRCARL